MICYDRFMLMLILLNLKFVVMTYAHLKFVIEHFIIRKCKG